MKPTWSAFAITAMLCFPALSARAADCYDSSRGCVDQPLDENFQLVPQWATLFACRSLLGRKSLNETSPSPGMPGYVRAGKCGTVHEYSNYTLSYTELLIPNGELGQTGLVPIPCGTYAAGKECGKKNL